MKINDLWFNLKIRGKIIENTGLGVFVNALYGISDGSIEIFNLIDVFIGFFVMIIGIYIQGDKQ
ncbi:MAG: hypothetical protein DSY40_01410 [Nautilia sp.]|nr:MAG: hypothetical protein DSY40_01410 [Nautilia sp.]